MQKAWRFTKRIFLILLISQLIYIIFCKWINPPITITQLGSVLSGYGLHRDYVSFNEMSPNIKLAVIASEDQLFPEHNGFDLKAIEKAIKFNEKHQDRRRGASTISQQVAKNVFLWQGGGFIRKGLEVYFTFMIELLWSKQRILETYLNVAEMGKGIFLPARKAETLAIIRRFADAGAEGVILGCTEIPVLLQGEPKPIPDFDTLQLHARAAVDFALV